MNTSFERVFRNFYSTARLGARGLPGDDESFRPNDGGGPFGFDITMALQVDYLINSLECDALIETGCYLGDTTTYLANTYPKLHLISCDIDSRYVDFTRQRLRGREHAQVYATSSPEVVALACERFARPFFYLDAHWGDPWPLRDELRAIVRGIVCIHDFNIERPGYAYDSYKGVPCDSKILGSIGAKQYWIGAPYAHYPFPCLQVGRRAGRAFLVVGLDSAPLEKSPWFEHRMVDESMVTPLGPPREERE